MSKIKIFVFIKEPQLPARHVWISASPDNIKKTIGGEPVITVRPNKVAVISHRDAEFDNSRFNMTIGGKQFFGTIILAGVDPAGKICDCPLSTDIARGTYDGLFKKGGANE